MHLSWFLTYSHTMLFTTGMERHPAQRQHSWDRLTYCRTEAQTCMCEIIWSAVSFMIVSRSCICICTLLLFLACSFDMQQRLRGRRLGTRASSEERIRLVCCQRQPPWYLRVRAPKLTHQWQFSIQHPLLKKCVGRHWVSVYDWCARLVSLVIVRGGNQILFTFRHRRQISDHQLGLYLF